MPDASKKSPSSSNRAEVDRCRAHAVSVASKLIRLPDSEPEPDGSLAKVRQDYYADRHPGPDDIFLVIEVAEPSLDFDCKTKLALFGEILSQPR